MLSGMENWLTEQAARWSCESCGIANTWYRENCGAELKNCIKEESSL